MLLRSLFLTAVAAHSVLLPGFAAPTASAEPDQELPPELVALLAAQPTWSTSAAMQVGAGYKDNLLLSAAGAEGSEFLRYAMELFLWRLPRGRTDFSAFLNAEQTRYLSARTIDDEAQAFAQLEWRYRAGKTVKIAIGAQGYYLDQVFDVSDTEIRRIVAELKVRGATFGPKVRWSFRPNWWLEAQAIAKREKYEDGENDSRLGQGALRLGWTGRRVEISAGGEQNRRRFDRRVQYSFGGRPIDDTLLIVRERSGDVRFSVTWDTAGNWSTATRLSTLDYDDNGPGEFGDEGPGFFNYRERKAVQEVKWSAGPWIVAVEGLAKRIDFRVQTVGFGISPPARIKDEYGAKLRVERKLSDRWLAYFEYGWERSRSNDPLASYRVNEGLLGARWSWEK
ncbi:MAG: hypothetical protein Q7S40_31215 [Opitutaceae bacterium]|nr:hypothetical protein [Opitutaceae bacterium]